MAMASHPLRIDLSTVKVTVFPQDLNGASASLREGLYCGHGQVLRLEDTRDAILLKAGDGQSFEAGTLRTVWQFERCPALSDFISWEHHLYVWGEGPDHVAFFANPAALYPPPAADQFRSDPTQRHERRNYHRMNKRSRCHPFSFSV